MARVIKMDQANFHRKKFHVRHGAVYLAARRIHPSVFVALSDGRGLSRGSVLIHNDELSRRTKQGVDWMIYDGMYSALRGMVHALRGGGAQPDVSNGELQQLALHPRILRCCIPILFSSATQNEYAESATKAGADYLIESLRERRDPNLLFARADLLRGMKIDDALGRRNPGAAAMNIGGAIHQVQERDVGLRIIMGRLNMRVIRIAGMIQEAVDVYNNLLLLFGGSRREYSEQATIIRVVNREWYSRSYAQLAVDQIDDMIKRLEEIVFLPSMKNAENTIKDLRGVRYCLRKLARGWHAQSANLMEAWIDLIRQAILWFRALHAFETEIYAPLSWVLGDIDRNAVVVRRAVHDRRVTWEETISVEDQERLGVIVQRIESYRNRVLRSSDTRLRHRIKAPVLARVEEALEFARSEDWREVKKQLGCIPSIL